MSRRPLLTPTLLAAALCLPACGGGDVAIVQTFRDLTVTPEIVTLPPTPVGDVSTLAFRIDNTGSSTAHIASMVLQDSAGVFDMDGTGDLDLARNQGVDVTVGFSPETPGAYEATISITSDSSATDRKDIPVRGVAARPVLQAWPGVLDLGTVQPPASADGVFVLRTQGIMPATVTALDFNVTGFTLTLPPGIDGLPFKVTPDHDVELQIGYAPGSNVAAEAELRLESNAPDSSPMTLIVVANTCNGSLHSVLDLDGDGFSVCGGDCDDDDDTTHPGAPELFDAIDNDCDTQIDEGTAGFDDDGDGFSEAGGDCDDTAADTAPSAPEVQDGRDNDCDGVVDDGTAGVDDDGDGFAEDGGDCDDQDPDRHPGAQEVPDTIDNDCDGVVDDGTTLGDDDGDGFAEVLGDCDDDDASISPLGVEVANGIDDDCDGEVDEGTIWGDDDGDGFSEAGGDCDDTEDSVNPAAEEVPGNGIDEDCDGDAD